MVAMFISVVVIFYNSVPIYEELQDAERQRILALNEEKSALMQTLRVCALRGSLILMEC
jgi:hypothetical protein